MYDIRRGDVAAVKKAISQNPGLLKSCATPGHRTALHVAAEVGSQAVVRHMLQQGADFTVQDAAGEVPLMIASRQVGWIGPGWLGLGNQPRPTPKRGRRGVFDQPADRHSHQHL